MVSFENNDLILEINNGPETVATIHELTVGVVTQVKENGEEVKTILEKENSPKSEENTESTSDMELEIDEKDEILEKSEKKAETSESCSEDLKMSVEKSTEKAESVEKMHVDEKPVELTEEDSDVKSTHQPVESPKINEKNFLPSEKVSETSIKTDTINDEQKIEKIIDDEKIKSPSKSSIETTKDISRPGTSSSIENSDYFVDSDDDLSHSSLDSELEDAELLRLIDNLDSD